MGNPFVEDLNNTFRGVRVRVETASHTYEGRGGRWEYDTHAFLIYDAEREDGVQLGATLITNPETVERLEPMAPIEDVPVPAIAPSPYSTRRMDDANQQEFIKQTREREHLLTYPTVRSVDGKVHDYEVVAGHRRFHTVQHADLDVVAVRVADLTAWEAVERFVDDHIPIEGGNERYMYDHQEIEETIARLREEWSVEQLRELAPLRPYLTEVLASTRREGIRQGYVTDGHR